MLKSGCPAKLRVSQSGTINPDSFSPSEVKRVPPSDGPEARVTTSGLSIPMRKVVITGIGVVSPIGIGSAAFWENLIARKGGIDRLSFFNPHGFTCKIAGQ